MAYSGETVPETTASRPRSSSLKLSKLNPRQREAVLHGEGPLLILAGAGSGKTSTMTYRIAHLIAERHVPADAILGLSFTNKAATELKDRVRALVVRTSGVRAARGLTVTTFHSLCVRILRQYADRIGFRKDFTILGESDQKDVFRQILKHIQIDDRKFDISSLLFQIGQAKNRFLSQAQLDTYFLENKNIADDYGIAAATSFGHYQRHLRVLNAMDFDDLLVHAVRLLQSCPDVRATLNRKYRYILVDEYQDTNAAQFKLLRALTESQQNICVVGDDDQSIYAWRGADPSHILEFPRHYPGARTVILDQNYRSTNTILKAANQVIAQNKVRQAKSLWSDRGQGEPLTEVLLESDREEGDFVAEQIRKLASEKNLPWKSFAVLYRSNPQSRIFEEALRRHTVPYKIVGTLSFLDRKEVKDVLSYWRLVANPQDDASLRRIINWPARGIGKTSLQKISDYAFENGLSLFDAFGKMSDLSTQARKGCAEFRDLIRGLREKLESIAPSPETVAEWAKSSLSAIGAKNALEAEIEDPVQLERRWENVLELVHSLGQTASQTGDPDGASGDLPTGVSLLSDFLTRMTLESRNEEEDELDQDADQVTLLTLHGSKGLEYPIVFLVGMEEGFLPHRRTLEEGTDLSEERRLCYVGMTRAKELLYLTRAKRRIRYGKPVPRYPSRFLQEIPEELLLRRDESIPDVSNHQIREKHEQKVKDYLAQIRANLMKGT